MEIEGRTFVVTGAGSGIGRATAHRLARDGGRIVVLERDAETAAAVVGELAGGGHRVAAIDVSDEAAVVGLFAELAEARLDIAGAVNAAGIVSGGEPWPATDLQRARSVFLVNSYGTALVTTLMARHGAPGNSAVVNISSAAAVRPLPPDPVYAASKAAVLGLTRSASAAHGLRVNAVLPGAVRTPMLAATGSDGVADWLAPRLERPLLTADQVAGCVVDLLVGDHDGEAWSVELDEETGAMQISSV